MTERESNVAATKKRLSLEQQQQQQKVNDFETVWFTQLSSEVPNVHVLAWAVGLSMPEIASAYDSRMGMRHSPVTTLCQPSLKLPNKGKIKLEK